MGLDYLGPIILLTCLNSVFGVTVPCNVKYLAKNGHLCYPCSAGYYKVSDCVINGEQSICRPCRNGYYKPTCDTSTQCEQCDMFCPRGQVQVQPCTRTNNLECQCKDGYNWIPHPYEFCARDEKCIRREGLKTKDNQPVDEKAKFQSLDNNYIESATNNRYKISGTQRYLAIQGQRVMTSVFTETDSTDANMMYKVQRYRHDGEGHEIFQVALCDEKMRSCIGVDREKNIIVKNEPEWFDISELGSEVQFKIDDLYLGYNEQEDQVDAQPSAYLFQEIPGEVEVSQLARQTNNDSLSGTKTDGRSSKRSTNNSSSSRSSDSDRKSVQSRRSESSGKT